MSDDVSVPPPSGSPAGTLSPEAATGLAERLVAAVAAPLPGLGPAVEELLAGYLAGGHVLLEGLPGVGKTLLARTFAAALGRGLRRIQFTPDLMPSEVTGTNVYDADHGTFRLVRGPVFTEILLADEVNRTPPKTQAALLEAMQEGQVSIDGETHPLPEGFFVVATQNPIDLEGTYPLPEAQLDRFLLRVRVALPPPEAEVEIYRRAAAGELAGWSAPAARLAPVVPAAEAVALRGASRAVSVAPELLGYLQELAAAVRASPLVELGPSPRGGLALLEAARAVALLGGRGYVVPDDLKRMLAPCWGHRVLLSAEAELEGGTSAEVLSRVAGAVPVPQ